MSVAAHYTFTCRLSHIQTSERGAIDQTHMNSGGPQAFQTLRGEFRVEVCMLFFSFSMRCLMLSPFLPHKDKDALVNHTYDTYLGLTI